MSNREKLLPTKTELNTPFFEGSLEGKLRLQRSKKTGRVYFPPVSVDADDLAGELEWVDVSGRATLWSWTVFHKAYFSQLRDEIPYPVIMVQLEEGPFMIATVASDVKVADLRMDMPLQVEFEAESEEFAIAKFRPVS
jgi:uncharacterized OB-fold protein